jgi:hypothetical protein
MFKPFCWESNACWGNVNTPEDWAWMRSLALKSYSRDGIEKAKCLKGKENSDVPCFGLYGEYVGTLTLGDWAKQNAIDLWEDDRDE